MKSVVILLALGAVALAATRTPSTRAPATSTTTTEEPEASVKEGEADGHRRHHHRSRWGFNAAPIIDRNVCDLDASVLVVVEGGRRGYNKARRVKCADVAAADEDSCTICCQNAARRDSSIRNEDIFGFLTVIDHFKKDSNEWSSESHDDDYARKETRRNKRAAEEAGDATEATATEAAEYHRKGGRGHSYESLEEFAPQMNYKNLKCLCCAPRRQLPPPPVYAVPVQAAPVYGAYQAYAQPAAPSYSAPVYQTPVAAAPAYQAPAAAAPQYQAPAAAPAY